MGGKRLKFPKRKKFIPGQNNSEQNGTEDKPISEDEHQKRIALLKSLGLVKEGSEESKEQQ